MKQTYIPVDSESVSCPFFFARLFLAYARKLGQDNENKYTNGNSGYHKHYNTSHAFIGPGIISFILLLQFSASKFFNSAIMYIRKRYKHMGKIP